MIDEFVSLVNPVLFEPPFPPEGAADLFEIANNINYTVTSYRPRIEGLFAKIEHWVEKDGNGSFWKIVSRDNVTSIFGKTENARIFDPENPSHIFEWLLSETFNSRGDRIWVYPGKGKEGFDSPLSRNKENGIPLPRKGSEEEIWQFTDIFGAGMQHLVRVTNGVVEC